MKITVKWKVNLKSDEVRKKVEDAVRKSLKDTTAAIANDAIKGSPVLTGNNRRSIQYEVGPGAAIAKEDLTAAIYSTSGYGGYIETGTVNMPARPYLKPAYDKNIKQLTEGIKDNLK